MKARERTDNLKIATCQFSVSGNLDANAKYIVRYIRKAKAMGADVVHFLETALTGYAATCPKYGVLTADIPALKDYDWNALRIKTAEIMVLAKQLRIWVILGSTHYISTTVKPTNCLYIISPSGRIVDRYDKRMCCDPDDLKVYTPGNRSVIVTIRGIKCGFLICADCGSPSLYHEYYEQGVRVLFHSYYNAKHKGPIPNDKNIPLLNKTKAREYGMWVIANNSSARHSCWPTCVAGPRGDFCALKRHVPGILFYAIPPRKDWLKPRYHTGIISRHSRAINAKSLP